MAKHVPDLVMDAALDYVAACTQMDVTSDVSTPANLTNSLADVTMAGGDFTKAQGDAGAGSRKVTMGAKSGVVVDENGTPRHVVLSLTGTIRLVTTCTGPDLTATSTVDFPAWKYEIGVPT
jgi:hypothetical protein